MTPADQATIERIALAAAAPWQFALGGGRALIAYGLIDRPTQDIDLFTTDETAVRPAAEAVMDALDAAGFPAWEVGLDSDLFDDLADLFIELAVSGHDGDSMPLSLAIQPRFQPPLKMAIGPVTRLEDLAASKVSALVNRAEVRDFIDVAMFLEHLDRPRLLELAARVDPGLAPEDYAACMRQLDAYPDGLFRRYAVDASTVRAAFAQWPRE